MSKSRCASISSRPLLTSVAEFTVTIGPIAQVGWASASADGDAGELLARSGRGTARRTRSAPTAPPRPPIRRAGTGPARSAPSRPARSGPGAAAEVTSDPPATKDSLLASASVRPACSAAIVGPRPMDPVMPLSTTSASTVRDEFGRRVRARSARCGPAGRLPAPPRAATTAPGVCGGLRGQQVRPAAAGGQPDDLELARVRGDDLQCLGADRTGGTQDQHPARRRHAVILARPDRRSPPARNGSLPVVPNWRQDRTP